MTLGEIISAYLRENDMSLREFANRCGGKVSYGYVNMLIKNRNPKTGRPLRPNIDKVAAIAAGMGITLDDLLREADDFEITLNPPRYAEDLTDEEHRLVACYRSADPVYRKVALELLRDHPQPEIESSSSRAG